VWTDLTRIMVKSEGDDGAVILSGLLAA